MGWVTAGTSATYDHKNTDETRTQTPILSDDWLKSFKNAQGNLNSTGATGAQQTAINWAGNNLANSPVSAFTTGSANPNLSSNGRTLDAINQNLWQPLTSQNAHQLGAAPTAAYAGDVTAQSGGQNASQYYNPFMQNVVNTSVNDYNTNVDRTLNGMRAGRNAAGAFGDRAAVADAAYQGDATRGLGSLVSGLYSKGFDTAQGLGQQDASRTLLADTSNQTERGTNNRANSTLLDGRDRVNLDQLNKNDTLHMDAIKGMQDNLKQQAGLTQQQLDNIVKANGIDTAAAQDLFTAGTITQEQLNAILAAAGATNGSNIVGNTNSDATGVKVSAGFGKVG